MDFDQLHTFPRNRQAEEFLESAQTCFRTQPAISAHCGTRAGLRAELFERFGSRIP